MLNQQLTAPQQRHFYPPDVDPLAAKARFKPGTSDIDRLEALKAIQKQNTRPVSANDASGNDFRRMQQPTAPVRPMTINPIEDRLPALMTNIPQMRAPTSALIANDDIEFRQHFQSNFSKLDSPDTRELALNQLQSLIQSAKQNQLRVIMSSLAELKRSATIAGKEAELYVISFVARTFGSHLLDPLDKPPNLLKTVMRLLDIIIAGYFREANLLIQKSCSKAILTIYTACLSELAVETSCMVLFDSLTALIKGGVNRVIQSTAAFCIADLIKFLQSNRQFIEIIVENTFNLFLKYSHELPDLIRAINNLLDILSPSFYIKKVGQIIEKTLAILTNKLATVQLKVESCKTLELLAQPLQTQSTVIIGLYQDAIIALLRSLTSDKVLKVQTSARDALAQWTSAAKEIKSVQYAKSSLEYDSANQTPDDLIRIRTGFAVPMQQDSSNQSPRDVDLTFAKRKEPSPAPPTFNAIKHHLDPLPQQKPSRQQHQQDLIFHNMKRNAADLNAYDDAEEIPEDIAMNEPVRKAYIHPPQPPPQQSKPHQRQPPTPPHSHDRKTMRGSAIPTQETELEIEETVPYDDNNQAIIARATRQLHKPTLNTIRTSIPDTGEDVTSVWMTSLALLDQGNFEESYKQVLDSGDDIYLIRLMAKTGPCLGKLTRTTASRLMKKIIQILKANILENLTLNLLQETLDCKLSNSLPVEDHNNILGLLYQWSSLNNAVGAQASELYSSYSTNLTRGAQQ